MAEFLTVKEAARRTGKSPSSIRRLIYPILENDNHPDRIQVQPSVEDALKLRMQGDNFAWRIGEEFLQRVIPLEAPGANDHPTTAKSAEDSSSDLLVMLKGELEIKNRQIASQAETIDKLAELTAGLSERVRESNLLIAGLQTQLSLTDGRERMSPIRIVPTPPPAKDKDKDREEGSRTSAKKATPKKPGLFRFFC